MVNRPISVVLVTGFLGSGKTTLLNRALGTSSWANAAVIINEVSEVPVDDALTGPVALKAVIAGGCICCTLIGDVGYTLRDLFHQRTRGEVPAFERILIEASGVTDPAPIIRTLSADPWLASRFNLSCVVTIVDGVHGNRSLDLYPLAARQIMFADRVLISKADLADPDDITQLANRIDALNPGTPTECGCISDEQCLRLLAPANSCDWTGRPARAPLDRPASTPPAFDTCALEFEEPLSWGDAALALDGLFQTSGPALLRVKGLLSVRESARPVVIQGVQGTFHRPISLESWPDGRRCSRIVLITHELPARHLARQLQDALFPSPQEVLA